MLRTAKTIDRLIESSDRSAIGQGNKSRSDLATIIWSFFSQTSYHVSWLCAAGLLSSSWGQSRAAEGPCHAQGELAGEVTATSVLLQTRLTALPGPDLDASGDLDGREGIVRFEYSTSPDFKNSSLTVPTKATSQNDFIVRQQLDGLMARKRYYYRVNFSADTKTSNVGPTREFTTLPTADQTTGIKFAMGSCMNYDAFMSGNANGGGPVTATEDDKRLGFPSFAALAKVQPDFFIATGDIVYYDKPSRPAATTLPELRKKWHEQFRFPRLVEFFGHTPVYWSKDDHDFRFNDADLKGKTKPAPETGIELFREQMPIHLSDDQTSPTYRTHRIGRDLQLWFTEGRDYRSPNNMPDGPEKSLWGTEQREWLKSTLAASDARWKVIVSPTPMVGPDDASKTDNHVNLGGFRHEADEFFQWTVDEGIKNLFVFCGDRHWQYHSIHPSGVEEFGCGALNDENSRMGVPPGSKKGTDPESKIVQPYTYDQPTGGFLVVLVAPVKGGYVMQVDFRDDEGKSLHIVQKSVNDI